MPPSRRTASRSSRIGSTRSTASGSAVSHRIPESPGSKAARSPTAALRCCPQSSCTSGRRRSPAPPRSRTRRAAASPATRAVSSRPSKERSRSSSGTRSCSSGRTGSRCRCSTASDEVFDRAGLGYAAVDLSSIHRIPCVLGVVRAPEGTPGALGVGAAAAPTVERAWWKALAEAFSARTAGVKLTLLEPDADERPVVSFEDHIRRYADHRHAASTAFLDAGSDRVPLESVPPLEGESPEELLAALCGRIGAAGSSAYAVDVTAPDVAELGLTVAKVIASRALRSRHSALGALPRQPPALRGGVGARARARADRRRRAEPRPAPVPVTRVLPTAQFASIVYGPGGVGVDDPAELFHEASRLYPNVASPRLEVLRELAQGGELATTATRSSRTHEPSARGVASRASGPARPARRPSRPAAVRARRGSASREPGATSRRSLRRRMPHAREARCCAGRFHRPVRSIRSRRMSSPSP